jgi:TctA family transporter
VQKIDGVPLTYGLDQNYPNPFNPSTTINYSIPVSGRVTLRIFNVLGQEVGTLLNSDQNAGKYQLTFDASRYSSGVYFYRIEAGTFSAVKKMMLLK